MDRLAIPILSTKQLPTSVAQVALDYGFAMDCIPFIETIRVQDSDISNEIEKLGKEKINVVFTSGVAAKAVAAMVTGQPQWNIFCIEGQTKNNVQDFFPQAVIKATAAYGEDLAREIMQNNEIEKVVFFCGNRRLDVLPKKLSASGIKVKEYVVYETKLCPTVISKNYKAILFFSPSGVESFFSCNELKKEVPIISIGTTTSKTIKNYCGNKIYTAPVATPIAMIELLKEIKEWN